MEGIKRSLPRGSIYTTIMELSPKRPSPSWFLGPNSTIVVYMDPLGYAALMERTLMEARMNVMKPVEDAKTKP